jgi:hypothetical protein
MIMKHIKYMTPLSTAFGPGSSKTSRTLCLGDVAEGFIELFGLFVELYCGAWCSFQFPLGSDAHRSELVCSCGGGETIAPASGHITGPVT